MDSAVTKILREIVGDQNVIMDRKKIEDYPKDETPESVRLARASDIIVMKAGNSQEVSELLRLCNERRVCVFPRGEVRARARVRVLEYWIRKCTMYGLKGAV